MLAAADRFLELSFARKIGEFTLVRSLLLLLPRLLLLLLLLWRRNMVK